MEYFVANWKSNMTLQKVKDWVSSWKASSENIPTTAKVIVAPTSVHLLEINNTPNITLATQDVSAHEMGAHTGELAAKQLEELCKISIVGHSERGEVKDIVKEKVKRCFENGVTPIVCFTKPEEASEYYENGALLAWEDPTNISKDGVYNPKDPAEIKEMVESIRQQIPEEAVLLYGGSVNKENIGALANIHGINGVLVGNASTDPQHFLEIINKGSN